MGDLQSGDGSLEAWMKSGAYLPPMMRDFHDQKDLFKTIHELVENSRTARGRDDFGGMRWIDAHCYTIDVFLWFMAKRGYTLQRSRQRLPFRDLSADVKAGMERWNASGPELFAPSQVGTPSQA
jgi:hypothetical protein